MEPWSRWPRDAMAAAAAVVHAADRSAQDLLSGRRGGGVAPAGGGGLGSSGLLEVIEVEALVETGQIAIDGDGKELVGHVHEDAVVAGGVLGEGGLELGGHEGWGAGGV